MVLLKELVQWSGHGCFLLGARILAGPGMGYSGEVH
jgi:hypothetical protein